MKIITTIVLLALGACIAEAMDTDTNGMTRIAKFVISTPTIGTYFPWCGPNNDGWYAGEIIIISTNSFRYTRFSDDMDEKEPDYSGPLIRYKDHIYLNHPGVPDPYRVAGIADGRSALLTWEGYEQWKKTGKIFDLNILYVEKKSKHGSQ